MPKATLLLGSNQGDSKRIIEQAVAEIARNAGTVERKSSLHRSQPWGFESANYFFNQVIVVDTDLQPLELLKKLQEIETELGRVRQEEDYARKRVYRDRPIDIDILFYDDIVVESDILTIPHPLIPKRRFVLEILVEMDAEYVHPEMKVSVAELLSRFGN